MKKLKIILKYNKYILLFIILFCIIFINVYKPKSKYNLNTKKIYGYVREINDNKLVIKGKEKIIVYTDDTNYNFLEG